MYFVAGSKIDETITLLKDVHFASIALQIEFPYGEITHDGAQSSLTPIKSVNCVSNNLNW